MLIKILRSGSEKHVDRDLGTVMVESGLAEEIVRDGGAKPASPPDLCQVIWRIGRSTADENVSVISYHCAGCRLSGGAIGIEGARQLTERPIYHRGVKTPPPDEIVRAAHGHANGMYKTQVISQHRGYEGLHPDNTSFNDADKIAAQSGTTPKDRVLHGELGSVKQI